MLRIISSTSQRRTRGANIARGSASQCPGVVPTENPGSAVSGGSRLYGAVPAPSDAGATTPPMGLRIVVLLALALIVSIAPARADTLDVYAHNAKAGVRYEGTVLVLDQVGTSAVVGFNATARVFPLSAQPKWPAAPGVWSVVVGSNNGIVPREWSNCQPLAVTYAESSGMHIAVECGP